MKEVFEKIIERLDKKRKYYGDNALSIFVTDGYTVAGVTNDAKEDAYVEAIEIVNQVAEEYGRDINVRSNDGWIACSERLPEEKGQYLVCDDKGNIYESTYYFNSWIVIYATDEVIAWMPLPQAYQPKGEK